MEIDKQNHEKALNEAIEKVKAENAEQDKEVEEKSTTDKKSAKKKSEPEANQEVFDIVF